MIALFALFVFLAFCMAGHVDLDETAQITPNPDAWEEICRQRFLAR